MSEDAIRLEERRLQDLSGQSQTPLFHERHRVFPAVFEQRRHRRIIDLSAGIGLAAERIKHGYQAELVCNDTSPSCIKALAGRGLSTVSFDLDAEGESYPFEDGAFDAVISLATIEHLVHIDHFVAEIRRILADDGYLYISTPNYAGLMYVLPFLITGRTFHNPLDAQARYEFYAHLRYFTYRTLHEYVSSFGFALESVYLPLPKDSTRFKRLKAVSPAKAALFAVGMGIVYRLFSPRWAAEPVLCFRKGSAPGPRATRPRKVVL